MPVLVLFTKEKEIKRFFSNYRPISVVSHLAKIQEKLVKKQFISYLLRHDLITVEQSAFLKDHSTVTCLHRVIDDWLEALNDREVVAVCFFKIYPNVLMLYHMSSCF